MQTVKKKTWWLGLASVLGVCVAVTTAFAASPTTPKNAASPSSGATLPDEASATIIHQQATSAAADAAEKANELARFGVFPRYGSLKKSEVNVRSGPGNQYPILWVYLRTGYPVLLLARYDNYLKIRDVEGEEGWVYVGMVAKQRTALVQGKAPVPLYRKNTPTSPMVARLGPGVIVTLDDCTHPTLCQVSTATVQGWVARSSLSMLDLPANE